MEEKIKILNGLKGLLLLNSDGMMVIMTDYTIDTVIVKKAYGFLGLKTKEVEEKYISSITFNVDTKGVHTKKFEPVESMVATIFIANFVKSRNRYLQMLKSLSRMGYTIKKK